MFQEYINIQNRSEEEIVKKNNLFKEISSSHIHIEILYDYRRYLNCLFDNIFLNKPMLDTNPHEFSDEANEKELISFIYSLEQFLTVESIDSIIEEKNGFWDYRTIWMLEKKNIIIKDIQGNENYNALKNYFDNLYSLLKQAVNNDNLLNNKDYLKSCKLLLENLFKVETL